MRIGTVLALWRYPVKSMAGEPKASASVTWRGIPGDRGWAVYDESRSGITGAKRLPGLRGCRARYLSEPVAGAASPPVEITLPDGATVSTDASDAAERLSRHFGRPVGLRALGPAGSEAAARVSTAEETPEVVRALAGVLPGEPMPDLSGFTPERLRRLRQGNFFDAFPIHLLTDATLRTLARRAPDSIWDPRRFRPNVLVAAEDGNFPEQGWIGRRVRVGGAAIEVVCGCPRCVMTTQPVDDLPQDHRVMRTLVRETRHTAGIYASVVGEGDVRAGDPVELLD
jgi:hypothetical protein